MTLPGIRVTAGLFPDGNRGAYGREFIDLVHIVPLHGDTAKCPVLIAVNDVIFIRPGTVDTD